MALSPETIAQLAEHLENCQLQAQDTLKITEAHPDMDWDDAYAIQDLILASKLRKGARVVGYKAGLTSHAKMKQMGVTDPVFGFLVDEYVVSEGATVNVSELIHPKVEPEIAFVLKHDLDGPGVTSADVLRATDFVLPCFEIVDSRIKDWKIKIQDTVADNASCGVFVLGDRLVDPRDVDLGTCGMVLEKNGEIVATGAGAAALGHPANAVAWLANTLGARGIALEAGEVILSGSLGIMVPVQAGDNLRVTIGGIGGCSVRFV